MEDHNTPTPAAQTQQRYIRTLFFALAGALFGALCAADSNVTMTLIADSFANDRLHIVVDEFIRDGGGLRGAVGAVFGMLIGISLFRLMSTPANRTPTHLHQADYI